MINNNGPNTVACGASGITFFQASSVLFSYSTGSNLFGNNLKIQYHFILVHKN